MAEGVRIRHHTRRNQLLPVPLLHKPLHGQIPVCGVCERRLGNIGLVHNCKTLHLELDDQGCVVVSREIWADLQRTRNAGGFTVANPVAKPAAQSFTMPKVQLNVEAIGFGGNGKSQYLTPDEYVDVMNQSGLTTEQAVNRIVRAVLSGKARIN